MSKVLFTEPAEYDLVSIEDYIRMRYNKENIN